MDTRNAMPLYIWLLHKHFKISLVHSTIGASRYPSFLTFCLTMLHEIKYYDLQKASN